MIEELKLLLPLLQQAGEGTFWLVVLFMAKEALAGVLIAGVLIGVAWIVARTILKLKDQRAHLSKLDADYEAVRSAWLYGKYDTKTSTQLFLCQEMLNALRGDKK